MYQSGFGNHHQTEAISGALPTKQNSPQHCPLGLYAEQISGSAFTRLRHHNFHTWMYRKKPSLVQQDYQLYDRAKSLQFISLQAPNPYRWDPLPLFEKPLSFIDGLFHVAGNDSLQTYIYQANISIENQYISNYDGEMLFVPYQGKLSLHTEMGLLTITPGQIAVLPRGIKCRIEVDGLTCGYICENSGLPLTLPSLGFMGSNALANPRHFLYPIASYEDKSENCTLLCKSQHRWWATDIPYSPLNVVAWHGNYAPYCYDLSLFNTVNTVSFDHPDPSIFTVLTSESAIPGIANLDFVIFPPRWIVAEHTFRPPYFHRNIMNELTGLITGQYDAKLEGFEPGGLAIHNCMTPHGPDTLATKQALNEKLKPKQYQNTLAFMFETNQPWRISEEAFTSNTRQKNYSACWRGL